MRLIIALVLIFVVAVGLVFGALNADLVSYDFGSGQLAVPKGAALLAALLLGWVLGGLTAWLGARAGLKRRRKARRGKGSAEQA
ncbi:DUF1049 domain-containing protein [Oleiagrimonas sp. C23AA]|uniref:DUF1049 domain-containing protein n=1 Tax=Oleiagrimonas sp. C23AA TaxID=2719047 RepID=UPI0014210853|nr:DUF1049 domain-containing protein [Oleiagrimonas sp. C23AA]NII10440.1 DUF1049 domain-containing protein [Oleiagrimonas sp. C23AA]